MLNFTTNYTPVSVETKPEESDLYHTIIAMKDERENKMPSANTFFADQWEELKQKPRALLLHPVN